VNFLKDKVGATWYAATTPSDDKLLELDLADWGGDRTGQHRREFDRATPLSDRGDFGAAFWARAGRNTPLAGAGYPHSPSLEGQGAPRGGRDAIRNM